MQRQNSSLGEQLLSSMDAVLREGTGSKEMENKMDRKVPLAAWLVSAGGMGCHDSFSYARLTLIPVPFVIMREDGR